MPSILTGGIADKAGNRYEDFWMMIQFLRLVTGGISSLRIEDPTENKAECKIITPNGDEFHQCKRSQPTGSWTLSRLSKNGEGILEAMFSRLRGAKAKFVFVSGSDCPELKALVKICHYCANLDEFEKQLETKTHRKSVDTLAKIWRDADNETIFEILKKIQISVIDSSNLREKVDSEISLSFLDEPNEVRPKIREFLSERVGQQIKSSDVDSFVLCNGFTKRQLVGQALINEITQRLKDSLSDRLIGQELLSRTQVSDLCEKITESIKPLQVAILGNAGGGKSAACLQLIRNLERHGIKTLAFRLDRLNPVNTALEVGQELDLEGSPAHSLAASLAPNERGVLIIDQLDIVSAVSGRNIDYLEAVQEIVREVRSFSSRILHVVLICRQFDWDYDHRFSRLLGDDEISINLSDFTFEEVDEASRNAGVDVTCLSSSQKRLLQRPQNLALFVSLAEAVRGTDFSDSQDLFRLYWNEKRRSVSNLCSQEGDRWTDIVDDLLSEMTQKQRLVVMESQLDHFPATYINAMVSEGVLSFQDGQYSFGHESFFDYCFARRFPSRNESLTAFLLEQEQHLFCRSQVRQVLVYLRSDDFSLYLETLRELLEDDSIRTHLKLLIAATLAAVETPSLEEWEIVSEYFIEYVDGLNTATEVAASVTSRVVETLLWSRNWFSIILDRGNVDSWLRSPSLEKNNLAYRFLSWHINDYPQSIALWISGQMREGASVPVESLLSMSQRCRWTLNHRPIFDLLIDHLESGQLDELLGGVDGLSNFWSAAHGLEQVQPEWCIDLLCVWLERRFSIIESNPEVNKFGLCFLEEGVTPKARPQWEKLIPRDDRASGLLSKALMLAPELVYGKLIPQVVSITERAIHIDFKGEIDSLKKPHRDLVWNNFFSSRYPCLGEVIESSIFDAIRYTCPLSKSILQDIISLLTQSESYFANKILLSLFASHGKNLARQAIDLVSKQPWRLRCGYRDGEYWVSYFLISELSKIGGTDALYNLEEACLNYRSEWETSKSGYKWFGFSNWIFLSGFDDRLLSCRGLRRKKELQRKFGTKPPSPPQGIRGGLVRSPIPGEITGKMSNQQWIRAMARYGSDRDRAGVDFLKGGAMELSRCLGLIAAKQPQRFVNLALTLPKEIHHFYFNEIIRNACGKECSEELKSPLLKMVYGFYPEHCAMTIVDAIGELDSPLSPEIKTILEEIASQHPDPATKEWGIEEGSLSENIAHQALNCTRGRAMMATAKLINDDPNWELNLGSIVEFSKNESSPIVRCAAIKIAEALTNHDRSTAILLFKELIGSELAIAASPYAASFMSWALSAHFADIEPIIGALVKSENEKFQKQGAILVALAKLYEHPLDQLEELVVEGAIHHRKGLAKVASNNLINNSCQEQCITWLIDLFDDDAPDVRQTAGRCFFDLGEKSIDHYLELFETFACSKAFGEENYGFYRALETTPSKVPTLILGICEEHMNRLENENASDSFYHDSDTIANLVFKLYQQNLDDGIGLKALDLIDRLCIFKNHQASNKLNEYER